MRAPDRPMNDVSGDRRDASAALDRSALASSPATRANARRSGTPSLRSDEDTGSPRCARR